MTYIEYKNLLPSSIAGVAEVCAVLFFTWYIGTAAITWYRLRHIPGPFLASFSYLWIIKNNVLGRGAQEHEALRKYGSIVRTGPRYIVTDDPEILRRINGARSSYPRDAWYKAIRTEQHDNMGTIIDTARHDRLKAKLLHGYNGRDNVSIEAMVDLQVTHLVDVIKRRYVSTKGDPKSFDLSQVIRYFTLDVITRLSYGEPFGFLDAEGDLYNYTNSVDRLIMALSLATDLPMLRWIIFSPLLIGFLPKSTDDNGLGKVLGTAKNIVKERFEKENSESPDMIGAFMRHGITQPEAAAEGFLTILAGSDTTAVAIRSTLLYLMSTPTVYHRLKNEIREAIHSQPISTPITVEQARKLPYLQAVIHEGFRMRPPAVYGHYKVVPPEGDTLNGLHIPGGTAIGHNSIAMMRSQKIFGSDADSFRPERLLECSEEKKYEMERTIDLVFGFGRWMCAGKMVAQVELNKIYFELMRNFDFQLIYPAKAVDEIGSQGLKWPCQVRRSQDDK
ncbi:hypothetical protein TruAng_000467 [Truncatella angustata]|nr:hypothetical protein TruAng_000467 [Truncatella angustata]